MLALVDVDAYFNQSAWECPNLETACKRFDTIVEGLCSEIFATDWVGAVGNSDNFRKDLFFDYKGSVSRKSSRDKRQNWFPGLKQYVADMENCVWVENAEADDYLAEWSTQLRSQGVDCAIITSDKDLLTVPGKILSPAVKKYGFSDGHFAEITKEQAFGFLCWQLIAGDSVDTIPGIPGKGPVAANLALNGKTPTQQRDAVIEAYKEKYDEEWKGYFLINGKLLWMRRGPQDWFTLPLFNSLADEVEAG